METTERVSETEKILRLLALATLEGRKQKEQVRLMNKAGFGQSEIAHFLDSTPKAISVRLAELRRQSRKAGASK